MPGLSPRIPQEPYPAFPVLTGPSWTYRVTRGLHVAAGTAAVPLLLVKRTARGPGPGGIPIHVAVTMARLRFGGVGVALGLVGASELVAKGPADVVAASVWLLGGVVVHDGVLAPVAIVVAALALNVLRRWMLPSAAAAAVVLGTIAIMAVPVLGRFGARADTPTVLDRLYLAGWLVFAGLVLTCAVLGASVAHRSGAVHRRERI